MIKNVIFFVFVFVPFFLAGQHNVVLPLNEEVAEHLQYKNKHSNTLHGFYEFKFKNKIQLKGRYVSGKKQGLWQTYHENGSTLIKARYENNMLNGDFLYHDPEQQVIFRGKFKNNKPSGTWLSTYDTGGNRRKITFDNHHYPVQIIDYYPTGDIAVNTRISIENQDTVIEVSRYFENTNIAQYSRQVNGQLHGKQIIYHSNGAKREELIYENGKLLEAGEVRTAIGKPLEASNISEGTGVLKQFYEYGGLYAEMNYKNGVLHDSVKKFQAGKLRLSGAYSHGSPIGRRIVTNKNYKKKYVYDFIGDTAYYQISLYNNFENKEEGLVVNGQKEGVGKTYDGLGNMVRAVEYQSGLKHGEYYENIPGTQSIRVSGQFQYGVRTGDWKYFNALGQVTYRELYDNNPELKKSIYEIPKGHLAYVPQGFDEKVNETFLDDIPLHNDLAYFLPRFFCTDDNHPNFDFFTQEAPYDLELRNIKTGFSSRFQPPVFQGNEEEYIYRHMFPNTIELPTSGAVLLRYKVDIFGVVNDVEIIRSIHEELDTAAKRLIESYPVMIPAKYNGMPVPVYVLKSISY